MLLGAAGAGTLLAACGAQDGAETKAGQSAAPATVEWHVWDKDEVWGRVAEQFTKQNPNIKTTVSQTAPSTGPFFEKLQASVAAGTAPDVAMASPLYVRPMAEVKVFQPVDDLAKKDRGFLDAIYPSSLDSFRVKGKLYGLWHYANPQVVFYNKSLLEASGAKPPAAGWTYQNWLELAKQVVKPGDPPTAVWGTDAPTSFNYVFNAIRSYGGSIFDDDEDPKKYTGTNQKTLDGLQFLADLLLVHRVAPTAADKAGQGNLFTAGRQGLYTAIAVATGDVRKNLKQEWDVAPLPKGPAAQVGFFGANGTAFTVPSNRNPAAAWTFLKFLGGEPGQKEYMPVFGAVPTVKTLAEGEYVRQAPPPASLKVVADAMNYVKALPKMVNLDLQQTLDGAFQAIFTGQKNAKAAMTEIEPQVTQLLK
jgi:multiple sugar transport system substrate-binding protein